MRSLVAASRMEELELERYTGSLAWALLNGVALDPQILPIIPHLRGSYLFGLLAVPLVWLFGPGLFALKVLAVGFGSATAAVFTGLVERGLGRTAGWFAVLWFAAAPPAFQMVDVLALGSHADTLLFALAPLLVLLGGGARPTGPARAALAGLLFGAGLLFSMQLWIAAPALLAAWTVLDPRWWRSRGALAFALAAAPGMALIPVLSRTATLVNRPIESRILPDGLGVVWRKLGSLLGGGLQRSWLFAEAGGALLGWLLYGALVGAACIAAWSCLRPAAGASERPERSESLNDSRRTRALALFALTHAAALIGAYTISDFELNLHETADGMGSRYMFPLWGAFGILGAAAVRATAQRAGTGPGALFAALLLAPGAIGAAHLVEPERFGQQPPVSRMELFAFQGHLVHAAGGDAERLGELIERLDPNWPELHSWLYGGLHKEGPEAAGRPLGARLQELGEIPSQPLAERRAFALGHAMMVRLIERRRALGLKRTDIEALIREAAEALPPRLVRWLMRGAGRGAAVRQYAESRARVAAAADPALALREERGDLAVQLCRSLPAPLALPMLEGLGFQLGCRATPFEDSDLPLFRSLDLLEGTQLAVCPRAAGWGYRARYIEASYAPPAELAILQRFSAHQRELFRVGLDEPLLVRDVESAAELLD